MKLEKAASVFNRHLATSRGRFEVDRQSDARERDPAVRLVSRQDEFWLGGVAIRFVRVSRKIARNRHDFKCLRGLFSHSF
jgi:hypothetical protein